MDKKGKKPVGRPPKLIPPVHGLFEAVVKALVKSVKRGEHG